MKKIKFPDYDEHNFQRDTAISDWERRRGVTSYPFTLQITKSDIDFFIELGRQEIISQTTGA
jgi:hypothetical protein